MVFILIAGTTYMLKRSKFPPLPIRQDTLHFQTNPNPTFPHNALSPNPPSRLQRRREDSAGKSSSLNCKLQRRNGGNNAGRQEAGTKNIEINNDYYPSQKQTARTQKSPQMGARNNQEWEKLAMIESAPILPAQEQEKREEEMSTELSRHSDCPEIKEVRFGGIMEGRSEGAVGMKRRDKLRSPSILKNGRTILNNSILGSKERQRSCSVASGRGRAERQDCENNTNKIIKQKYRSILGRLQTDAQINPPTRNNRFSAATYQTEPKQMKVPSPYKYRDEIFPPVASSIFAAKKGRQKMGEEISWMRVSDIFKGRQLTLVGQQKVEMTRGADSYAQDYFVDAMNCLAGHPRLLEKIFEGQNVNPFGIYLLRIYQQSVWKYIIIDDYIPVLKSGTIAKPAFLSIRVPEEGPIDIWPFLLEKAYANYYSRYEALLLGSLVDFVEELAGTPGKRIQLKTEGGRKKDKMGEEETIKALQQVKRELKAAQVMMVGQLFNDSGSISLAYSQITDSLIYYDPFDSFCRREIAFNKLSDLCRAVHIISPFKFQTCSSTIIRKGRPLAGKEGSTDLESPSVRMIKIENAGEIAVSLRQREKRLFHLKEEFGEYIWCRLILLQREGQHGFRWIAGEYAQRKAISFIQFLEPGEYWLLVEPQWRLNSPSELTLHLYARNELPVERVIYKPQERVIQSACLDLAQRFGQLNQINKYICSYNYVTEQVGLIIENIVNERVNGDVTVMRSIRGLKCKVQILPINREFYEEVETEGEKKWKLREEIELDIPKGETFTVVLKLKGGIDRKFFRSFDFGC